MTKQELSKAIGNRIVELREQKGWKQTDLAKACGKVRAFVQKIENGDSNPTIYSLHLIANCLEVQLDVLVKIRDKKR